MKKGMLIISLLLMLLPALSLARIVKREGVDIPTRVVIIKEGDTLRKLAEEYLGSKDRWREFLKVNIISDPELIMPGERLYVPILPRETSISSGHPAMLILQPTEDDTPEIDVNPVMTEHLIVVRAIDSKGNPVPNVRVEWVLSDFPGSTGDIVEADDEGKVNNRYAVTYTNSSSLDLKRNPRDGRSLKLEPGDTWVGISATYPGQTKVVAICPSIPMSSQRTAYVTCQWLDIAWEFPPDSVSVVNFSDNARNAIRLITKVFKATDGSPIEGMKVSYSILKTEGLIEAFFEDGAKQITLQTDAKGLAEAALGLTEPGLGKALIGVELFDRSGQIISKGEVSTEWKAPQLKISVHGPVRANMMEKVKLQIELSNSGTSPARKVRLNLASGGFRLVGSIPNIDEIAPGKKMRVSVEILPIRPGSQKCTISALSAEGIQSIGEANMEVIPPRLKLSINGPEITAPGSQITYTLSLSNEGNRSIDGVELKAHIPTEGMKLVRAIDGEADEKRETVTWKSGRVSPGSSESFTMILTPLREGIWEIKGEAIYGDMSLTDGTITRVTAPKLSLTPSHDILAAKVGRSYEIELNLTNSGTSDADDVRIEIIAPDGVEIDGGKNEVQIGRIGTGESKPVKLEIVPTSPGRYELNFEAISPRGGSAKAAITLVAVAKPELKVEISDSEDPVILGNGFSYTILVTNVGSAKAEAVKLMDEIPSKLKYLDAKSPIGQPAFKDGILSLDLGEIGPGDKIKVTLDVKAVEEGDVINRVTLQFAGPGGKITAEEMTSIINPEGK